MTNLRNFILLLAFSLQSLHTTNYQAAPLVQTTTPEESAQILLETLTPEERVGQLFLIDFNNTDTSSESQIYDLVANYHIGGVMLKSSNDNFNDPENTLTSTWTLNQNLQTIDWQSSQNQLIDPILNEPFTPAFIPLFIGISQEGDGYPYDEIMNGLTPLPNAMALGATWNPELARQTGFVLGHELSMLGFNLLLGPSLDVLETPNPENLGAIGTRSFGGDPYWVGKMGSVYISGVHQGSNNQIAVIGKHFPGHGGSDRPPEEEIPTVFKSLEQLKQIELAPFFAVTSNDPNPEFSVDGLLLSHISYQGFLGNYRATTRPVSFDDNAFNILMDLPEMSAWREYGGVIVSDQLGSRAVRRWRDPTEMTFNSPLVARDAFLAGNDLLYLGDFTSNNDPNNYTSIANTLEFFSQKYRGDVAFAQRVDESVLRILTLKFRLYPNFYLPSILPSEDGLENIGESYQITFDIGSQAATLFWPSQSDLDTIPPGLNDRIVFITDTSSISQCPECDPQETMVLDALQQAVVRLYGLEGGGLVLRSNLTSHSFAELEKYLDNPLVFSDLFGHLRSSSWVVFGLRDVRPERSTSQALRRLLSERPDLLQGKRVIVFAFNAPYFLDATDIPKLTAYYGIYSKIPEFVDVAARLLFNEITAPGASPVSVSSVGYDLIIVTSPDPSQIVPLTIELVTTETIDVTPTPVTEPDFPLELMIGDQISLTTGVIQDYNGHPVPDNTPVRFIFTYDVEGVTTEREIETTTVHGIANTTYLIETSGSLELSVTSGEPEARSEIYLFEIPAENIPPATETPQSPIPEITETPRPTSTASPTPEVDEPPGPQQTTFTDWLLSIAITAFFGLFAYQSGSAYGQVRWGVRWALSVLIGGFSATTYLAFGLPGSESILARLSIGGIMVVTILGAGVGWGIGWIWKRTTRNRR
jgi:beta-N-acetylhexosaminidase